MIFLISGALPLSDGIHYHLENLDRKCFYNQLRTFFLDNENFTVRCFADSIYFREIQHGLGNVPHPINFCTYYDQNRVWFETVGDDTLICSDDDWSDGINTGDIFFIIDKTDHGLSYFKVTVTKSRYTEETVSDSKYEVG